MLNLTEKFSQWHRDCLKSTYMDDSVDAVSTEEDRVKLYTHLSVLWKKADRDIYARKWQSNSVNVLQHIPLQDAVPEIDMHYKSLPSIKTPLCVMEGQRQHLDIQSKSIRR